MISLRTLLKDGLEYLKFGINFFVQRKKKPYILGLVINDKCNLHCKHCRVANLGYPDMSLAEIKKHLFEFYQRGARFLYLEGGEPYLWRDGNYRLNDILKSARRIGYLRSHIYTNATKKLDAQADFTWISIDGLEDNYQKIRGIPLTKTLRNTKQFRGRGAIVFTVNTINQDDIDAFLYFMQQELPGRKVIFFFHTPYYGEDELLLSAEERKKAISTLLQAKRKGLPVLNSTAGLQALENNNYKRPSKLWWVVDKFGEYPCCRAYMNPKVCEQCGYSSCVEIILAQQLKVSAMWGIMRFF